MPKNGIIAVTALLDFIYITQCSAHNATTLGYLDDALTRFHQHQDYFIKLGVREDFNIPKFHSLLHYITSIKLFGTTDNYNTELFERLHIGFAKEGWRASNRKGEFPQMINWLSRHEKIAAFEVYLKSLQTVQPNGSAETPMPMSTTVRALSGRKRVICQNQRFVELSCQIRHLYILQSDNEINK